MYIKFFKDFDIYQFNTLGFKLKTCKKYKCYYYIINLNIKKKSTKNVYNSFKKTILQIKLYSI